MSFGEAAKDAHPKAGKRWSQDVIGHVAPELSTYDLAQSLTYGGAFGPDMAKQTVTEPGLLATTEDELRATAVRLFSNGFHSWLEDVFVGCLCFCLKVAT